MTTTQLPFTIDRLERDEHGHWAGTLTVYGDTIEVDQRFGAWRIVPEDESKGYRELLYVYAKALADRVKQIERSESKQDK